MNATLKRPFPIVRIAVVIGVLAVFVPVVSICLFTCRTSGTPESAGPIVCPDAHWNLGTINVTNGIVLQHEFVLRNTSSSPVQIGTPRTSCGCVTVTPSVAVLPPSASCQLKARISIIPSVKSISQCIEVPIEHSNDCLTIAIDGQGIIGPAVVSYPRHLTFGTLSPGQSARQIVYLAANTGQQVRIKSVASSDPRVSVERISDDPSKPAIAVSLSANSLTVSPTTLAGSVTVTFDGAEFDACHVPFAASFRTADVRLMDSIVVGKLTPGSPASCELIHPTSAPLEIESVTYQGDAALHVEYKKGPRGSLIQVASAVKPRVPRRASGILLIKVNSSNVVSCVPISAVCAAR